MRERRQSRDGAGVGNVTPGIVRWLIYGLAIQDWPPIAPDAITLALMVVIPGLKLRFG
jgi:hypothetical protein